MRISALLWSMGSLLLEAGAWALTDCACFSLTQLTSRFKYLVCTCVYMWYTNIRVVWVSLVSRSSPSPPSHKIFYLTFEPSKVKLKILREGEDLGTRLVRVICSNLMYIQYCICMFHIVQYTGSHQPSSTVTIVQFVIGRRCCSSPPWDRRMQVVSRLSQPARRLHDCCLLLLACHNCLSKLLLNDCVYRHCP